MTSNPSGQGFQNKNRVAILAELDKEKRKLLMQNQSSTNHPGANRLVTKRPCWDPVSRGKSFPAKRVWQALYPMYELPIKKSEGCWLNAILLFSISLARSSLNKDFRDHAEQQHIAAQQKAALQHAHAHSSGYFITQDSAFGNLILPVLPRLDVE